ncbi:MAG: signal peptidase II [bacterium]
MDDVDFWRAATRLDGAYQVPRAGRMFGLALALTVLDQLSKAAARHGLEAGKSLPIIGNDFFRLTLVENPGSAFGLRLAHPTLLLIINLLASVALAVILVRLCRKDSLLRFPIALLLTGAFGNSIDRIFFGHVTDFLDFDFPNFIMERWPVFNVADSCVTIGMISLVVLSFLPTHSPSREITESAAQD